MRILSLSMIFICSLGHLPAESAGTKVYESEAKADFYPLAKHYVTQKTQTYCGIASAVMVLNAMGVKKVVDPVYYPNPYLTQDNFFTESVLEIIQPKTVLAKGVTLDQIAAAIETFGVTATVYHMDEAFSYEDFVNLMVTNLHEKADYIIVNFDRRALGQEGAGHISPIAAYNEEEDSFLILDVSRYKYAPVWVPSRTLFEAMQGIDPDSGKPRGFLLVKPQRPLQSMPGV